MKDMMSPSWLVDLVHSVRKQPQPSHTAQTMNNVSQPVGAHCLYVCHANILERVISYSQFSKGKNGHVFIISIIMPSITTWHNLFLLVNRPLPRNKMLPFLNLLKRCNLKRTNGFRGSRSQPLLAQLIFFPSRPMLVNRMTAIIGPFDFFTDNPMQVEQMIGIIGRVRFFNGRPSLV